MDKNVVIKKSLAIVFVALFMGACTETQFIAQTVKSVGKTQQKKQQEVSNGKYKIGDPYQVKGVWYYPREDFEYDETGISSWYGTEFHGRKTANGEIFDMNEISAAHKTLQMPSWVRVTNLENGRSLNIRVNDRGPYAHGRIIDLSRRAAQLLGFQKKGTARVRVKVLGDASRTIAARFKGRAELASVGSPITVDSLPKPKVSSETLPVLGTAEPAGGASVADSPLPAAGQADQNVRLASVTTTELIPAQGGIVTIETVSPTSVYVQAGAFANFENANRVRARLISVGPVRISPVLVNGRDLFRVRVGPMASIDDADRMLERIIEAGYTDARTLVD